MKTIIKYAIIFAITLISFNATANNPAIPNGIVYQLTIKSSDIQKSREVILEYPYLRKIMTQNIYEYQFGKYTNFKAADSVKTLLTNAGCADVTILAYNNHILIPLTEAISLQYKEEELNTLKNNKKSAKTITTKEVNYLIQVKQSGLKHYYSLAVPVYSIETVDKILEEIDNE